MIWPTAPLLTHCVLFQCSSIDEHGHAALHSLRVWRKGSQLFYPSDNKSISDGRTNQNPGEKISDLKVVNGTYSQTSSTGFQEKYYTCREL